MISGCSLTVVQLLAQRPHKNTETGSTCLSVDQSKYLHCVLIASQWAVPAHSPYSGVLAEAVVQCVPACIFLLPTIHSVEILMCPVCVSVSSSYLFWFNRRYYLSLQLFYMLWHTCHICHDRFGVKICDFSVKYSKTFFFSMALFWPLE